MTRNYLNFNKKLSAKLFTMILAFVFIASSCNQTDEEVAPVMEDMPSLTEALEAFDEEVEYTEVFNEGSANARWGFKRWKRKPTFFTLVAALNYTGLLKTVIKEKLTVFAPDDRAFAELGLNFWNIRYKIDKETLTGVLLNHVADGFVFSTDLDCSLQTLGNSTLRVVEAEGKIAFQDDSEELTNLLFADRRALRSVFHGIDKVLTLSEPDGTIADIAIAAAGSETPEFTQLVAALQRTSGEEIDLLAAVLNPDANLTVFAPIDQAFFDLYVVLEDILGVPVDINAIPLDLLTQVLLHHVVGDRAFSNCLGNEITTLNEDEIKINLGDLTLESSGGNTVGLVVDPFLIDIKAVNGVVHVIDGVLVPKSVLDVLLP